jgi:Protein of unknown function (DUF2469)
VSAEEDLDQYEAEIELALYQEYRAVLSMFKYVIETDRRFYLANETKVTPVTNGSSVYFDVELTDAWVWDMYRAARFVPSVRIVSLEDVNIETLPERDV